MAVLSRWRWGSGLPGGGAIRGIIVFALIVLLPTTGLAAPGDINTVAGVGNFYGEGVPATQAKLFFPHKVALDHDGNIYIADSGADRIRKVNITNGIITTVAGNGQRDYGGDGGPATEASLNYPTGVAVDGGGNIYIADGNCRIRKVSAANGFITTVAGDGTYGSSGDGGPAIAASIYAYSIALDSLGNIYIAGDCRIRKISAANGYISTVAGNGTAGFSGDGGPSLSASLRGLLGVTVDGAGNIFIADAWNNRIRKVNAANGIISTVAGNGTSGFAGDGGLATSASLDSPSDVAVDGSGNIYIGCISVYNSQVRKISGGVITTVAGQGIFGYGGDGGLATSASLCEPYGVTVDVAGTLYITDESNHRIRKVNSASGIITTVAGGWLGDGGPATMATLVYPRGIAVDGPGNIYIADTDEYLIRKVNRTTGTITTVAGNGLAKSGGDGGAATAASFRYPTGVAVDGTENIYISDLVDNLIRKVSATDGTITTVAGNGLSGYSGDGGPATWASLKRPNGVAVDGAGNIYIAGDSVRKVDVATGIISTVAGGGGNSGDAADGGPATLASLRAMAVAIDSAENLYISESVGGYSGHIWKVNSDDGTINRIVGTGVSGYSGDGGPARLATITGSYGVAVNGAGDIYISDYANYRIRKISASSGSVPVSPAKIGAYSQGSWYLDKNGNGAWDTGTDFYSSFGTADMIPVTGNWNGTGPTKAGAYINGTWYLDLNGNGQWDGEPTDKMIPDFGYAGALPVTGDWNGDGVTEIGVYDPNTSAWYLDMNGSYAWDGTPGDTYVSNFGFSGCLPVVGDWNGNGRSKIGVFFNGQWYLDTNGNFAWDGSPIDTAVPNFGFAGALPVAGDWDGSGHSKIGVYYNGQWYFDTNGNFAWDGTPSDTYVPGFGFAGALPVVGHW